ncbi:MAG: glucosamine-6-phosphate deaminase [Anaerostipes sp.]|nr:glucosamine-6-phosphate deaminase [Anaerostipes sp.]
MRLYQGKDYDDLSKKAAQIVASEIFMHPKAVLGLATGSSPEGIYRYLVKAQQEGTVDFSDVTSVNLDEYKGMFPDNEQSYHYFMEENLFQHVPFKASYLPNAVEENEEKSCREYDELIESLGGIDMQILGIGANGHIGFNEPGEVFERGTHCVTLAESTRQANSRFFDSIDDVPTHAFSMGIGTILSAKRIVLIVSGENKAQALYDAFYGPITPKVPASALQLHGHVAVFADKDALSVIKEKGLL